MTLKKNLTTEVKSIFSSVWSVEASDSVPSPEDLRLNSNHAKDLEEATVLYADLDGSTSMVDNHLWEFSAEVYKAFLRSAADIIRNEGGSITAYDGDRIMAVFTGSSKNTTATRCAMKINYAVANIIQPAINAQYSTTFKLVHVVGIDTSRLRTARIGVRGDNDLVWIGRAANYAAKLTNKSGHSTWITKSVYDRLRDELKYHQGINMWTEHYWREMGNTEIYSSDYWWTIE